MNDLQIRQALNQIQQVNSTGVQLVEQYRELERQLSYIEDNQTRWEAQKILRNKFLDTWRRM